MGMLKTKNIVDFTTNVNPLGAIDGVKTSLIAGIKGEQPFESDSEVTMQMLLKRLCKIYNFSENNVVVGSGVKQLMHMLPKLFSDLNKKNILLIEPISSEYETVFGIYFSEQKIDYFSPTNNDEFQIDFGQLIKISSNYDVVFLTNPNILTGVLENREKLFELITQNSNTLFVVDESFIDFCDGENNSFLDYKITDLPQNLIITKSLINVFALAGLGLDIIVSANLCLIDKVKQLLPLESINSLEIIAGCKTFENKVLYNQFIEQSRTFIKKERSYLINQLSNISQLEIVKETATNFILLKLLDGNVDKLCQKLLDQYQILVSDCNNFKVLNGKNYFRIALKKHGKNVLLVKALIGLLCGLNSKKIINNNKKIITPSLMFQGTCSNAGKSIMTAAMCRILQQDGVKVAPFKAQNMALNSFVTESGDEIGRAQALQAMAANLIADVRMNPILLKPNSTLGSQVIVMGQPWESLIATDYFKRRRELFKITKDAYSSLADDYDCIILEGAGSAGEINLKQNDIVNMNMAKYAQTNVLLVGDIDRGGVYASFIGTYATFLPWERELLKGFIVNKFHGDPKLLADAHEYLYDYTQKPCLGIIPHFNDIILPEEDSVSFDLPILDNSEVLRMKNCGHQLDIAVIGLPHISNFTDIAPLTIEKDLIVRKVRNINEFGDPDIIIIPGSKNVIYDMEFLRESRLADVVINHVKVNKKWLIGICGGLQICGKVINDPHNVESQNKNYNCLNLLPLETTLAKNKILRQTTAIVNAHLMINKKLLGCNINGYEIHHGETFCANKELISMYDQADQKALGFVAGKVWTTYLHGVFDDDEFRNRFLNIIREDFNLPVQNIQMNFYDTEAQLNKLAEHVRKNIDIDEIYKIMGI